jgi:four helix bundle protein
MGKFRDLEVWQLAMELVVYIYQLTNNEPFARDFDLRSQIRRASVSIPSNIAEGDEGGSNKMSIRYFNIAKGSLAEVQTQAEIAFKIGYITKNDLDHVIEQCERISKKTANLIKFRSQNLTPKT